MKTHLKFLFACILIGCTDSSNEKNGNTPAELYQISFDLENLSKKGAPMMSEIIDSLEYIKLEYNPDFQIGSILGRPYISEDYIFILCSHKAGLLQFKRNGEFVRKIGSYGRGPGEYLQLRDFSVDEKKGMIYTIPNWKTVLCTYDYSNGKFIEEIPISYLTGNEHSTYENNISSVYPFSDSDLLINPTGGGRSRESKYNVFYTINLSSGNIIRRNESKLFGLENLKIKAKRSPVLASIPNIIWYDSNDRLNFWESLNDTVFVVNSDFTKTPRIIVDFGSYKLDIQTALSEFDPAGYSNKLLILSNLCESSRYFFFLFAFQDRYISTAYDKTTGDQYLLGSMSSEQFKISKQLRGIYNDIDGGFSNMMQYDKNMWFASYSAIDMLDKLTPEYFNETRLKVKFPNKLDRLKEFVFGLDDEDNPVFMIAHLKQKTSK